MLVWKDEKEKQGSRLNRMSFKTGKDWNGNNLIHLRESKESEDEKEKERKKFRREKKSEESQYGEEEKDKYNYRLMGKT